MVHFAKENFGVFSVIEYFRYYCILLNPFLRPMGRHVGLLIEWGLATSQHADQLRFGGLCIPLGILWFSYGIIWDSQACRYR